MPFDVAQAVIRREVERYNREAGRRSHGAAGRSYIQVFEDGLATRIVRRPTARQLYLASLIYKPVSVDRYGQVTVDKWVYGSPGTQADLLPYHGNGQQILLGRDPDDLGTPAIAFDEDYRLICEGIEPVKRGAYDSKEGIRTAARNRKAARDAIAAGEQASDYLAGAALAAMLAALGVPDEGPKAPPDTVVGARFGGPLNLSRVDAEPEPERKAKSALTPEMLQNFDRAIGLVPSRATGKQVR